MLRESPFLGDGHPKVRARLRAKDIRVGKTRTLWLMRENDLLAAVRRRHERGERSHSGTITTSAYVGEPEYNGIMERFIRTLKEECLYIQDFHSLEEARDILGEFIERYKQEWLRERHGHRTPADVRPELLQRAA